MKPKSEKIKLREVNTLIVHMRDGKVLERRETKNLITNVGHAGANGRMSGLGGYSAFTAMAIGIGAVAANVADTTLGSEITTNGGQRAAGSASQVTTGVANDTTQLTHTWT